MRANGHEIVGVFAPPDGARPDALAARALELGLPLVRRRFYRKKSGRADRAALDEHAGARRRPERAGVGAGVPAARDHRRAAHKSLCFHPSLLPRFRGGAALQWQIILGERETGVSIFVPDEGVDTGPVVVQKGGVAISPRETAATLFFEKLQPLGVEALVEAVELVAVGRARKPETQDESRATHAGPGRRHGRGDPLVGAGARDRSTRARLRSAAGRVPALAGKPVRLFDAALEPPRSARTPGSVVACDDAGLAIALRGGSLRVKRVRADAGKEAAQMFARRVGLAPGAALRERRVSARAQRKRSRAPDSNVTGTLAIASYDALVPAAWRSARSRRPRAARSWSGNGGRALWERFERVAGTRARSRIRSTRTRAACSPRPRARATRRAAVGFYADKRDGAYLPLVALAQRAGFGTPGRVGVLIHPSYGPWLASAPCCSWPSRSFRRARRPFAPCDGCPAPCASACHGAVIGASGLDSAGCYQTRLTHPGCAAALRRAQRLRGRPRARVLAPSRLAHHSRIRAPR